MQSHLVVVQKMMGWFLEEILLDRLKDLLVPLDMPGQDLQYMNPEKMDEIRKVLQSLDLSQKMRGYYQPIMGKNSFVPGAYIDID